MGWDFFKAQCVTLSSGPQGSDRAGLPRAHSGCWVQNGFETLKWKSAFRGLCREQWAHRPACGLEMRGVGGEGPRDCAPWGGTEGLGRCPRGLVGLERVALAGSGCSAGVEPGRG